MAYPNEYWTQWLLHDVIFKVELCGTGKYDYYNGRIMDLREDCVPMIASIVINDDQFWTEVHGTSLTTSSRRHSIVNGRM